jgi:hypothetical protein
MSLVKIPSTKTEGVCHSSIFYGLFENEKMNEWRVATISNTAENKEGRKQECVNLEAFIFDFTHYQSLKSIEVVFFLWMEIWGLQLYSREWCGRCDVTWARVLTMTMTKMTMTPLRNYNQQEMIYQTRMIQQMCESVSKLDEFNQTLISLLSFFNPSHTIFNIRFRNTIHL